MSFAQRRSRYFNQPRSSPAEGDTVSVGVVSHTYAAQTPQVRARVQPGQVVHTYTGQVPALVGTLRPAQVTHSYVAQTPQVRARVQPAQVVHTYTAQSPQVRARVQPGAAVHTYAGQVPGITAVSGVAAPAATHTYVGQAPQVRARVQPGAAVHTYTGQVPTSVGAAAAVPEPHAVIVRRYKTKLWPEWIEEQKELDRIEAEIRQLQEERDELLETLRYAKSQASLQEKRLELAQDIAKEKRHFKALLAKLRAQRQEAAERVRRRNRMAEEFVRIKEQEEDEDLKVISFIVQNLDDFYH